MLKIIDLSYPHDATTISPGHPEFTLISITTHEKHGRRNTGLTTSMHVGTHVDSPFHFVADGIPIDQVPLERLFGTIVFFDLRGQIGAKDEVTVDLLKKANPGADLNGKVAMVCTEWLDNTGHGAKAYFTENPAFHPDAAKWLVDQNVKCVALDFPPDFPTPGGARPGDAPVHRTFLGAGVLIVENLCNLQQVKDVDAYFCAMPIKLAGQDGGLTRAVAIVKSGLLID
ncbi:cyclase family protein [Desulfovibrio sp. OttesenSCG-928-O18]|nr:cyclase family protein [Desulfovibrio sp. OttesenSCG-928-O18]